MHKLLFLLALTILAVGTFSQPTEQDPLIMAADSLFEAGEYEQAAASYLEYIDSQKKIRDHDKKSISEVCVSLGLCYYKLDKYEDAIKWFREAEILQKEIGDREAEASSLNNIGLSYKKLGNFEKAIEYYEQTVIIDEESGNVAESAKTLNNIGMIYRAWGKYDQAIEHFERSLEVKKILNDTAGISTTLNNMGLVYTEWKKFDQAVQILEESLAMEEMLQNDSEIALRYNNLGRAYFMMQRYDTALAYFKQSLDIHLARNEKSRVALEYNNIGKVYQAWGQMKEADSYFSSALSIYSELGMESEKATVLANLGKIHHLSGDNKKALVLMDSSTYLATKLNLRSQLESNYLSYSDIYSGLKDFERALDYYKKYSAVQDSMFTKETLSRLSEFQARYEKEKDLARILTLEKENLQRTYQRNGFMFGAIGAVIIIIFVVIYFRQRAGRLKLISDQKIRQLEEEKKLLAAKVLVEGQEEERKRIATEIHDGLGVLLSVIKMQFSIIHDKSPANKELIEKASEMLEQASSDVRKISHNMMPGLLTKFGFFEAIEDLFENIGDNPELNVVCNISGNPGRISENKEIMLYRIVQEMVNNTLKHAQAKNISLTVHVDQGILNLEYSDDGKGFDFEQNYKSRSMGLQSIQSRVDFLNGKINVDALPGKGMKYTLRVPV